jgi:hypothetical protein
MIIERESVCDGHSTIDVTFLAPSAPSQLGISGSHSSEPLMSDMGCRQLTPEFPNTGRLPGRNRVWKLGTVGLQANRRSPGVLERTK